MCAIRFPLFLLVGLGAAAPANGQQREGFHLSLGVGGGFGHWDIVVDGRSENSGSPTFATSFEVGHGLSDVVTVFYHQRTAWFNSDVTILPGEFGGPATPQQVGRVLTQGITGLGVRYYLSRSTRTLFVSGGIGLSWWSQVFEENTDCIKVPILVPCTDITGVGVTVGGGYQLAKWFSTELIGVWGSPSDGGRQFNVGSDATVLLLLAQFSLF